jgi:hypothetical protein
MLNAKGSILTDNRSLTQWAGAALGLPEVQVQVRLRGNHLHILCEAADSPPLDMVVAKYSAALSVTDLEKLLPRQKGYNHPKIYQVFLCGRRLGARQNDWAVKLDYTGESQHLTPLKDTEVKPLLHQVTELADVAEVKKSGKKKHKSQVSATPPIAEPIPLPNVPNVPVPVPSVSVPNVPSVSVLNVSNVPNVSSVSSVPNVPNVPVPVPVPSVINSQEIRNKNHTKNVTQMTETVAERSPSTEAFVTSPLTIDTASTFRLTADSIPFDAFSHPMTVGQTAHQNTAILEVPLQKSNGTAHESGLTISCEGLARRGYPDAIASYLSEILGALGVAVKVSIREQRSRETAEILLSEAEENGVMNAPITLVRRLWVLCESAYSPDPSLLAEPIARRLRDLKLENFRDAVICSQVRGEKSPEWLLRVDLTPQSHILKEWARWGDGEAIARLLNQELANLGIEVRATLKEFTLHLFCHLKYPVRGHLAPDQQMAVEAINHLLTAIAPCGIRAATVYGLKAPQRIDDEIPVWIDWLNLPAAQHPDLAVTPESLAIQGDREALLFLINRLLNPNLDQKLQTGGIRAMILPKRDLLHIMTEAPICPSQSQVGPPVGELLRQLKIPGISGVRVYGRRAGQKLPLWRYGVEVQKREEVIEPLDYAQGKNQEEGISSLAIIQPKSLSLSRKTSFLEDFTSEFAASATDMSFTGLDGALVLVPDFSVPDFPGEVLTTEVRVRYSRPKLSTILLGLQRSLIASGLFVPNDALVTTVGASSNRWRDRPSIFVLVWAATGCLLAFQVDTFLGNFLESGTTNTAAIQLGKSAQKAGDNLSLIPQPEQAKGKKEETREKKEETREKKEEGREKKAEKQGKKEEEKSAKSDGEKLAKSANNSPEFVIKNPKTREVSLPDLPLHSASPDDSSEVFNASGFTKRGTTRVAIAAHKNKRDSFSQLQVVTNYPSFKSDQLDEQLVRYQKYIQQHQRLPDIMIVGSSRALRGIEPRVLEKALAEQGYPGLMIYNFGVNGATVQVVDLILRQVLPLEQLPKLILLADGARAVNSGRVDVTYNAIATSQGYKDMAQGTLHLHTHKDPAKSAPPTPLSPITELMQNINDSGVTLEEFLHQKLLNVSGIYRNRDRLKALLYSSLISPSTTARLPNPTPQTAEVKPKDSGKKSDFDSNGFLPIDLRFDPATYYQKYSQVTGDYDADYQSFKLVGKQTDALKNLWEYTKANNINLVFVNMPLTKEYLDPVRTAYEQQFHQKMQEFATETGLNFRDLVLLWPEARENFSDPSHLNRYGAVEVSKYLAKDSAIPWSKIQDRP